jgi:hypothetical protein
VVRGIDPGGYAAEMQQHLNAGCEVCRRDRDLWLRLFYFGRNDGFYEPPEEITQQVKGLFNKRGYGNLVGRPQGQIAYCRLSIGSGSRRATAEPEKQKAAVDGLRLAIDRQNEEQKVQTNEHQSRIDALFREASRLESERREMGLR